MRRLLSGVFAASFLLGMLSGCATTSSSGSCGSCGSTGCSSCGCGSGGCGGGCGEHRLNLICHTAGVCDCDRDEDPCAHRAPWAAVRPVNYPLLAKSTPATTTLAPVYTQSSGTVPAAPQAMPTSNVR